MQGMSVFWVISLLEWCDKKSQKYHLLPKNVNNKARYSTNKRLTSKREVSTFIVLNKFENFQQCQASSLSPNFPMVWVLGWAWRLPLSQCLHISGTFSSIFFNALWINLRLMGFHGCKVSKAMKFCWITDHRRGARGDWRSKACYGFYSRRRVHRRLDLK